LNSEEFRETFLRNDREGPTKAEKAEKMAEKKRNRKSRENQEWFQKGWAEKGPESAVATIPGAEPEDPGRRKHHIRGGTARVFACRVDVSHERVHGTLPRPPRMQFLSIPLSEGKNKEGEKPEAL
jgi:hypothetical protein